MSFSVTCPACGKSFQLAEEIYERKVAGKVVSIKCKQCQAGIRIDATKPGELKVVGATPGGASGDAAGAKAPADAAAQAVRARQPTLIGMMGPGGQPITQQVTPDPPGAAPGGTEGALWAVDSGGAGEDRELDDETMRREIVGGLLNATTLVWRDGMDGWSEISAVPQLARYLASVKERSPAAAPSSAVAAPRPKQPSIVEVAPAVAAPSSCGPSSRGSGSRGAGSGRPSSYGRSARGCAARGRSGARGRATRGRSGVGGCAADSASRSRAESARLARRRARLGRGRGRRDDDLPIVARGGGEVRLPGAVGRSDTEAARCSSARGGRPAAPLPAAGRPAPTQPFGGAAPRGPAPAPAAAPRGPAPAPAAAAPVAAAPAPVPEATPAPPVPAAPAPPPMRAKQPSAPGLPPPAPPPMRAKQPSAAGLPPPAPSALAAAPPAPPAPSPPAAVTPPPAAAPPPPPPPSTPAAAAPPAPPTPPPRPPSAPSAAAPALPTGGPPMRARQPSAPGFPPGLIPPPARAGSHIPEPAAALRQHAVRSATHRGPSDGTRTRRCARAARTEPVHDRNDHGPLLPRAEEEGTARDRHRRRRARSGRRGRRARHVEVERAAPASGTHGHRAFNGNPGPNDDERGADCNRDDGDGARDNARRRW